jgi:starch synthase
MIASRYGAIPVTRETGGLYDSIKHYYIDEKGKIQGNGFTLANYGASELYECAMKAFNICKDKEKYTKLVQKIMETDFSWSKSAKDYMQMYDELN